MTDDVSEETQAEGMPEAQAVLAVIGRLNGMETLPRFGPDGEEVELPGLNASLDVLARTSLLSGPAKLEVLAQAARAQVQNEHVQALADSLVRIDLPDLTRDQRRDDLVSRLRHSPPGHDPLNRSFSELLDPPQDVLELVPDLHFLAIEYSPPDCDSEWVKVEGIPALSIKTRARSTKLMRHFVNLVDPRNWPTCPLQHAFFRSMKEVPPPPPPLPPLQQPDVGWSGALREIVDFSVGLGWATCETDLDFVYFADASRVGCTYDFHHSTDGRINVDQGYLLLEDLKIPNLRQITTLKQVHFRAGVVPPEWVCPVWSTAMMIISWACTPSP